jgi:tripartite-type tricarboxylate transporter receptor subunit TctC
MSISNSTALARLALLPALLCAHAIGAAPPADYPARALRLIVPSPPGASNDAIARLVSGGLSRSFDKPVVVDNRAGGGGIIAAELVARAPADGHTLLFAYAAFTTAPFLQQKLPYDSVSDFAPITEIANQPLLLVVHASVPVNTVKELIALCKARPNSLTAGHTQVGSATHLTTEIFKIRTDTVKSLVSVSYKGGAAAQVALLSGEIQVAFATTTSAIPQLKTGKVKAIATSAAKRLPYLPDVPTLGEAGLPGFEAGAWQGVLAPAGTPRAIIDRLHSEIVSLLKESDTRQRLAALGSDPVGSTPAEFKAKIQRELQEFEKIIKALGLKP